MREVFALATLVVLGVMLANVIANPKGTQVVFNGLSDLWKSSINGLLAKPSN